MVALCKSATSTLQLLWLNSASVPPLFHKEARCSCSLHLQTSLSLFPAFQIIMSSREMEMWCSLVAADLSGVFSLLNDPQFYPAYSHWLYLPRTVIAMEDFTCLSAVSPCQDLVLISNHSLPSFAVLNQPMYKHHPISRVRWVHVYKLLMSSSYEWIHNLNTI